jgi:hypothetical protein
MLYNAGLPQAKLTMLTEDAAMFISIGTINGMFPHILLRQTCKQYQYGGSSK